MSKKEQLYEQMFRMIDTDNSGQISAEELKKLMIINSNLSEKDVDAIMKKGDVDGDGQVSLEGNWTLLKIEYRKFLIEYNNFNNFFRVHCDDD